MPLQDWVKNVMLLERKSSGAFNFMGIFAPKTCAMTANISLLKWRNMWDHTSDVRDAAKRKRQNGIHMIYEALYIKISVMILL